MMTAQNQIPVLSGKIFKSALGYDLITIRCPFCGRTHTHGFDGSLLSRRCAHCADSYFHEREYFLTPLAAGGIQ